MVRSDAVALSIALLRPVVSGKMRFEVLCALMLSGSASVAAGATWIGMLVAGVQLCLRTPVLSTLGDHPLLPNNLLRLAPLAVVVIHLHPLDLQGKIDAPLVGTS